MFPENSGIYIAKRENAIYIVKVKGMYPLMWLDKKAINLGEYLKSGKNVEVPQDVLDNIELFHNEWKFFPLNLDFSVFSNTEFAPNGEFLYLSEEDILSIRGKYYRMCQSGISPLKIIRALSYEFKISKDQIIKLINKFDVQATNIN